MIKAIDTYYNGNYYRSRLEARWAVFFESCGIRYEYESEGFKMESGRKYLPDFHLPDLDLYIEVKPDLGGAFLPTGQPNWDAVYEHEDFEKWQEFSHRHQIGVLFGRPHNKPFWIVQPVDSGLVLFHLETRLSGWGREKPFWRLWNCSGDEESDDLIPFAKAANKKRFEHDF